MGSLWDRQPRERSGAATLLGGDEHKNYFFFQNDRSGSDPGKIPIRAVYLVVGQHRAQGAGWQGYLVTTNTGLNRQYVHVNSATLVGRKSGPSVRVSWSTTSGMAGGQAGPRRSIRGRVWTCRTSPAAFELFSRVYYQVRFEISGISYYSYTFCEITPPNNKCGR